MHSQKIDRHLIKVKRLRLLRLVLQISLLVVSALLLNKLSQLIAETYLIYHPVIVFLTAGILLAILTIFCVRIYFRETTSSIARELDSDHKLKDRLSTYIELRDSNHPFLPALISESETHLPVLSLPGSAHFQKGSTVPLVLTSILALGLATFPLWPVPPAVASRAAQHRQVKKHTKQLIKDVEQIKKSPDTPLEIKKLAEEFRKTADRIDKPDIDPAQALQKINAMQKQLKDLQKDLDKERKQKFAKDLNSNKSSNPKSNSQNRDSDLKAEVQELQEALEKEGLQGGEELQQKLQSGNLTREDLKKMQKALENYRADKKTKDQKLAELQQSIENARKGMTSGKRSITYNSKINENDMNKKEAGVEDGPGTTNKDAGPHHFDTKKKGESRYAEDRTKDEYEQLYSGQRENVGKDPLFLGSKWDAEKSRYVRVRSFGEESDPEIVLDQTQMVAQTEEESAIGKEKIPAAYRDLIRRYFNSIEK
jgi:hypothetical protein